MLSIVVPVRDSATKLRPMFESLLLSENNDFEVVVNDDPRSSDGTKELVDEFQQRGLRIKYLLENDRRALGRSNGARAADRDLLLHLDSDMEVSRELVGECIDKLTSSFDALVVPERSFGTNFWARVRGLEKLIYDGVESIEGVRALQSNVYRAVGGHNIHLIYAEDKDLDLRVRATGARVGRTSATLLHNEGAPTLRSIFRKKLGYLNTAPEFANAHPNYFAEQTSVRARIVVLVAKPKLIARHPLLFVGLLMIGAAEVAALVAFKRGVTGKDDSA